MASVLHHEFVADRSMTYAGSASPIQLVQYADLRSLVSTYPRPLYSEEKDDEVKDDSDDGKSRRGSRQSSRQRLMGKTKEFAEMAVQDEGGDVDNALVEEGARTSKLMKQKRSGSKADIKDVGEPYPLEDESSWAAVPKPEVSARFNQYRELARDKLAEFEGQIQQTIGRTQRKIASLKEQFSEHKSKWEQERIVLIEQIEAAQNMQSEAEQEADQALQQLEQFIEEQEAVEVDEASRLNELEELSNKLQPIPPPVHSEEVGVGTEDAQTQEQLLQQTDDAKARELERHKSDMTGQAKRHSASTTRLSSAPSRASSSKYRKELEKLRSSAQSRRSKTPQSDLSELKSRGVQGELIEPEDEDSALPDDLKELMSIGVGKSRMSQISAMVGTTPPPSQHNVATAMSKRSGTPSVMEHPVTESFFTIYAAVTAFKDEIARFLMDKDMTSYSQLLQDIEAVKLEPEADVLVQIDNMTRNSQAALDEVQSVFASVVSYERDPVVSSLGGLSRANTFAREKTTESTGRTMGESTSRSRAMSRATDKSAGSGLVDEDALNDVQNAYDKLKDQLEDQARRHQDETNHTTVVMMEMQDTINRLQRELSVAERQRLEAAEPQVDPPQVFTSTDRERNAKTLRRALDEERISAVQYEKSLEDMEEYVRQPAKRVSHLAKKFVHHKQMKQIEESVRQSHCLSDQAFEILDKMEALQNKRAEHWAGEMDVIGAERERLATQLDMTLSSMERDAGVFLIKPTYYIKPRPRVDGGSSKMTRPMRALPPRMLTPMSRSDARSVHDPAPTPASVIAKASSHKLAQTPKLDTVSGTPPLPPLGPLQPALPVTPETGISGSPLKPLDLRGGIDDRQPTFNLASSQITRDTDKQQATGPWMNTPRMLEMDVNRMLIGQNTISARLGSGAGDEVGSANTRGYVTVQRPAGSSSANRSHRPNSHTGLSMDSHPMSSPTNRPESQPLPPINGRPSSASSITIHPSPLAV